MQGQLGFNKKQNRYEKKYITQNTDNFVYGYDEFNGKAYRTKVSGAGKKHRDYANETSRPDEEGMVTSSWKDGSTWKYDSIWHKQTASAPSAQRTMLKDGSTMSITKKTNRKEKLLCIIKESKADGKVQQTQINSLLFDSEQKCFEFMMQIVEAFKTGAISTKGEAEQLKLEKVRELRHQEEALKRRPASSSAPKPAAKQLEAGQDPEEHEQIILDSTQ